MNEDEVVALVGEHSGVLKDMLRQMLAANKNEVNKYTNENARLRNELLKYGKALDQIKALGDQVTVAEAKRIAGEALQ